MIFTGKTWVFHFGALFWNTEAEATSGRARRTSSFLNVSNSNWLHCVHNEKANNIDPGVCYRQHSKRRERHRKKKRTETEPKPKPNRNRRRRRRGGVRPAAQVHVQLSRRRGGRHGRVPLPDDVQPDDDVDVDDDDDDDDLGAVRRRLRLFRRRPRRAVAGPRVDLRPSPAARRRTRKLFLLVILWQTFLLWSKMAALLKLQQKKKVAF